MVLSKGGQSQQDEELVLNAQQGDGAALAGLFAAWLPLVRRRAALMRVAGMETDDLTQEGMIGLLRAVHSYRRDRNASFKTYANTCIHNKMVGAARLQGRKKNLPLNRYLSLDEGLAETAMLKDPAGDPEERVIGEESAAVLYQSLKALSEVERDVLMGYLGGKSYVQIAKKLEITPKSVDNAMQRIRKKLRSALFGKIDNRNI